MLKAYVNHLTTLRDRHGDPHAEVQFTFKPDYARCYETRQDAENERVVFLSDGIEIDSSEGGKVTVKNFRVEQRGPKQFVISCEGPFIQRRGAES